MGDFCHNSKFRCVLRLEALHRPKYARLPLLTEAAIERDIGVARLLMDQVDLPN